MFKLYTQRDTRKDWLHCDSFLDGEFNTLEDAIEAGNSFVNNYNYMEQRNCNFYVETDKEGIIYTFKEWKDLRR